MPVGHTGRPGLPGVVFADLVVLPVGRPNVPCRGAVTAAVLEAVVALAALHTLRSIFTLAIAAIPRRSEVRCVRCTDSQAHHGRLRRRACPPAEAPSGRP